MDRTETEDSLTIKGRRGKMAVYQVCVVDDVEANSAEEAARMVFGKLAPCNVNVSWLGRDDVEEKVVELKGGSNARTN
jgi:hypothetical protein